MTELPDWIEKEVDEANREHKVSETRARKSLEYSMITRRKGPTFWQQLIVNLRNNTDNLPSIGLSGDTALVNYPKQGEQSCRVSVTKPGASPKVTHTDIFYTPGATSIRSRTVGDHEREFVLRVLANSEIGAMQYGIDTKPRDASQMAAFMVQGMATMVRQ